MFVASTIFLACLLIFLNWCYKQQKSLAPLKKLRGTPPTILLGDSMWMIKIYSKKTKYDPAIYLYERMIGSCLLDIKAGMRVFWYGLTPIVNVYGARICELILSSSISLEKSLEYVFLHQWLGKGLLTSDGTKWKTRRKLLTPSFHFRILDNFLPVFHTQSMILVKKFRALAKNDFVDVMPNVVLCTLDIVCETVMGAHIAAQEGENSEYVQAMNNLGNIYSQRVVKPYLWSDFLFSLTRSGKDYSKSIDIMHNFTKRVIREKKENILKNRKTSSETKENQEDFYSKHRKALMDLLLDLHLDGQQLSEEDIREEVDTFMFEGHDTTAMGITFGLYCIGLYPKVQKKIEEELYEIFGDDKERQATQDDVRNMKYLDCTLKESQRIFPSVPIIGRKLNEDIHIDGQMIPKGTTVHLNMIVLHRNPEVFPNPEIFDPDRFLPENSLNRHAYAYLPFSAGPRNCIGQKFAMLEEKVVISNILRNFNIVSLDPRDQFHLKVEFTLRPAQPVRLKFIPKT